MWALALPGAVVLLMVGVVVGDAMARRMLQPELTRLRLVRERVHEFAVRATKECEMTMRDDVVARQTESMGAQLLEVIELAER